jgi:hypothetical protein
MKSGGSIGNFLLKLNNKITGKKTQFFTDRKSIFRNKMYTVLFGISLPLEDELKVREILLQIDMKCYVRYKSHSKLTENI